ncbi:hypothetical protein DVH24_008045, partial [Malus domestica]
RNPRLHKIASLHNQNPVLKLARVLLTFGKTLVLQLKNSAARGKLIKVRVLYKLFEAGKKEKSAHAKIKTTSYVDYSIKKKSFFFIFLTNFYLKLIWKLLLIKHNNRTIFLV